MTGRETGCVRVPSVPGRAPRPGRAGSAAFVVVPAARTALLQRPRADRPRRWPHPAPAQALALGTHCRTHGPFLGPPSARLVALRCLRPAGPHRLQARPLPGTASPVTRLVAAHPARRLQPGPQRYALGLAEARGASPARARPSSFLLPPCGCRHPAISATWQHPNTSPSSVGR